MQRFAIISFFTLVVSCNSKTESKVSPPAENWVITNKVIYDYKLNAAGYPDSTFVLTLNYKNGALTDTSTVFFVSKYNGNNSVTDIKYYARGNDKAISQTSSAHYVYDNKNRARVISIYNSEGLIMKDEKFTYDESDLLQKYVVIRMKTASEISGMKNSDSNMTPGNLAIGYDTVICIYKYDQSKKIIVNTYTDPRGNFVQTDENIYSGNDPLLSYSINAKGDTVQRIKYEINGKMLTSRLENDSFILWQNTQNSLQIAQKTVYKNKNEKWRTTTKYDNYGRKTEETVYKGI